MANFIPIKGDKAQRMINTETGEVVSRRQYLTQKRGGITVEQYAKENKAKKEVGEKVTTTTSRVAVAEKPTEETQESRYVSFVRSYSRTHNMTYTQTTRDAEFKMVYRQITDRIKEMKKLDPHIKGGTKDTILRKLLKDSGIPENEWYFIYLG